jgi:hypothetical protein
LIMLATGLLFDRCADAAAVDVLSSMLSSR